MGLLDEILRSLQEAAEEARNEGRPVPRQRPPPRYATAQPEPEPEPVQAAPPPRPRPRPQAVPTVAETQGRPHRSAIELHELLGDRSRLRTAVLLAEVLGRPKALRRGR